MDIRINKYLSSLGVCSRREADRLIEAGNVTIDGRVCSMGEKVNEGSKVEVNGKKVGDFSKRVVIVYHKPAGVICTTAESERPNLTDVIDYPVRLFPIGRLDKDSTGVLLLTNDGDLADFLMRGRNSHEKEYIVTTDRPISDSVAKAMEQGVPILDTMTKPCRIFNRKGNTFHIILTQGLNRQIRRMCEYFDYRVIALHRVRFVTVTDEGIDEGCYRELNDEEIDLLRKGEK